MQSSASCKIPGLLNHKLESKLPRENINNLRYVDPVDCSLPGSFIHSILQARILEWVAISFSRGSSQPRDQTQASHIGGRCFNLWATREAPVFLKVSHFMEKEIKQNDTKHNIIQQ